jgi:hypothetical protein
MGNGRMHDRGPDVTFRRTYREGGFLDSIPVLPAYPAVPYNEGLDPATRLQSYDIG